MKIEIIKKLAQRDVNAHIFGKHNHDGLPKPVDLLHYHLWRAVQGPDTGEFNILEARGLIGIFRNDGQLPDAKNLRRFWQHYDEKPAGYATLLCIITPKEVFTGFGGP